MLCPYFFVATSRTTRGLLCGSKKRRQGCPSFLRASLRYGVLLVAQGGHGVGGGGAAGGGQAGGDGGADEQHGDDGEDDGVAGGFVDPAGGEFAEGEAED